MIKQKTALTQTVRAVFCLSYFITDQKSLNIVIIVCIGLVDDSEFVIDIVVLCHGNFCLCFLFFILFSLDCD